MIFREVIMEALTPEKQSGVSVRSHVRRKPRNPLQEQVHSALRASLYVPTEPEADGCSRQVSA